MRDSARGDCACSSTDRTGDDDELSTTETALKQALQAKDVAASSLEVDLSPTEANANTALLLLPQEIKNRIWELAVVTELFIRPGRLVTLRRSTSDRLITARLRRNLNAFAHACRQLSSEVLPIYYGQNTFRFVSYDLESTCGFHRIAGWVDAIGPVGKQSLRNLQLHIDCYEQHKRSTAAKCLLGVKSVAALEVATFRIECLVLSRSTLDPAEWGWVARLISVDSAWVKKLFSTTEHIYEGVGSPYS